MVAGHLQEKNGMFYVVLNYRDENGKRKTPWISTNLPVKGNKKRAETFMMDVAPELCSAECSADRRTRSDAEGGYSLYGFPFEMAARGKKHRKADNVCVL